MEDQDSLSQNKNDEIKKINFFILIFNSDNCN